MPIKRILTVFSGVEGDAAAGSAALLLAKRFVAHIDVLHARDTSLDLAQLTGWGFEGPAYVSAAEALEARAEAREDAARHQFESFSRDLASAMQGRGGADFVLAQGRESDQVIQRGAAYDLIIVRRPEAQLVETAEAALFYTGRQVLLAPPGPAAALGRRIFIAWNQSAVAARAVAAALPLLETAERVSLFHVKTAAKQGTPPLAMLRFLEAHGVRAALEEAEPDRRAIGEAVLEAARGGGADLIVAGAYSHSRFRERILGGVTSRLFSESDLPLLMAH